MLRSRRRSRTVPLVLAVLLSGCLDDTSPLLSPDEEGTSVDGPADHLPFSVPALSPGDLTPTTHTYTAPDPSVNPLAGPALTDGSNGQRPLQQIFRPDTRISFLDGYVAIFARHDYIGNLGRVYTEGHVTFQNAHLGSQDAETQDYTPFWFDFGRVKNISTEAKIWTDHTCGLTAQGDSKHEAWWQMYQGRSAPIWGKAIRTTQARPTHQGSCAGATGQTEISEAEPSGMTCYYLITYDLGTGQIYNAELLYCTSAGPLF